jgi:hypothetical protein
VTASPLGNLIVAEAGNAVPNKGRLSIVYQSGERKTLIDGMPNGTSDVGTPSGPSGVFMKGRTLFVAIGIGDSILPGPPMSGIAFANPSPSSPLYSSILAVHLSAHVERRTSGFTLTESHQATLARGFPVVLANSWTDWVLLHRVADFPDYIPAPRPDEPANVRGSNPFDLVGIDHRLYVTDGGRNHVWKVSTLTGATSILAAFPAIPNTFTPAPPAIEAVPTGIAASGDKLFVTLFRGAPFAPGASVVQKIDAHTGEQEELLGGLRAPIDVRPVRHGGWQKGYLVLVHSAGPVGMNPFGQPGKVLWYEDTTAVAVEIPSCLQRPTSMVLNAHERVLYVTELNAGRIVIVRLDP